jgi:hypothetical protein
VKIRREPVRREAVRVVTKIIYFPPQCHFFLDLQPDIRFNMFAEEMQHQPRAHKRKGYVGLAVIKVKMASRDVQGIVPPFLVQMDSDHVNTSSREVQMKLEPFNQPAALLMFHLDIEGKTGIGPKLHFFTHQFLDSSFEGGEPGGVVRLL